MSTESLTSPPVDNSQDPSIEMEQGEQPNENYDLDETTAFAVNSSDGVDEQTDPNSGGDKALTTGTTNKTFSFEMGMGKPFVETAMSRFHRKVSEQKSMCLFRCAVLLAILILCFIVIKFCGYAMTSMSPRRQMAHLVQSRLPSVSFRSNTSPESKALDWIVHMDELDHTELSDDRLVQRFAIASVVFAFGIEGEGSMLTGASECKWEAHGHAICFCDGNSVAIKVDGGGYLSTGFPLPATIGLLTNLQALYLEDNGLTGPIPTEVGMLSSLATLDFSDNDFTGSIPSEIGLLLDLTSLYFNHNTFTGPIPSEIGLLTSLLHLHFHENGLSGSIPSELGLVVGLIDLKLYGSDLTGSIPTSLCSPRLHPLIDCGKMVCGCCADRVLHQCLAN